MTEGSFIVGAHHLNPEAICDRLLKSKAIHPLTLEIYELNGQKMQQSSEQAQLKRFK